MLLHCCAVTTGTWERKMKIGIWARTENIKKASWLQRSDRVRKYSFLSPTGARTPGLVLIFDFGLHRSTVLRHGGKGGFVLPFSRPRATKVPTLLSLAIRPLSFPSSLLASLAAPPPTLFPFSFFLLSIPRKLGRPKRGAKNKKLSREEGKIVLLDPEL